MELISPTSLILIIIAAVVLFFLLRFVNLWYWKINRRIELQEETNSLLRLLVGRDVKIEIKTPDTKVTSTEQTSLNDPEAMADLMKKLDKTE